MRQISLLTVLAVALALNLPALCPASTGGEESPPEFSGLWLPARPASALMNGPLGVVEPTWWRRPLLLAWFRLNGQPLPVGVDDAFSYDESHGAPDSLLPASFWIIDGQVIAPDLVPAAEPSNGFANLPSAGAWDQFENCPRDAWDQARRTLADRVKAWGADSVAVRDWVAMQHRVFARCSLGPVYFVKGLAGDRELVPQVVQRHLLPHMQLTDPPAGTPALLAHDRAYQRASALLYEGHYELAEAAFSAIAADTLSPWQSWGRYLAFRARLRAQQVVTTPLPAYDPCDGAECRKARQTLRARRWAEAQRLHSDIQQAITLAAGKTQADERRRLRQLDTLVAARLDPARRFRELAALMSRPSVGADEFRNAVRDYLYLHRQQPPGDPMGEWLAGLVNGGDPTGAACDTPTRDEIEQHDCLRRQWSQESLRRHAQRPQALAWLFSAAALSRRGEPQVDSVLKALAAVPSDHPAAATMLLQRLRLGPGVDAQRLASELLSRPEVLADPAARNLVREHRMWHADSLESFWADALREPGASQDRDTQLRGAAPKPGKPSALDRDALWVLDRELSESALMETARRAPWEPALRARVATAAFARAVLRRDVAAARAALVVLQPLQGSWAQTLVGLKDDQAFMVTSALQVRRGALLSDSSQGGDCRLAAFAAGDSPPPNSGLDAADQQGHFAHQLLSPARQAEWQRERRAMEALPDQDALWMQAVLNFSVAFPNDPRVPELLRDAVYTTRNNWCTAASSEALSKKAFELLKRRYPASAPARSTRYWFKPSS